jgi:chemotaxis protein MotB
MPPGSDEQPIIVKKIIKKGGHAGHHGGAWKVAYADFVTAMMCMFLLLWLVNSDPSTKAAVAEAFKQPTQTGPMQGNVFVLGGAKNPGEEGQLVGGASFLQFEKLKLTGENKERVKQIIQSEFKESLEISLGEEMLENVNFHTVDDGILIEIQETKNHALFSSGSAVPTDYVKKIVDTLAAILRNNASSMLVAGHTDSNNYGVGSYDNWNLSTDRAQIVRKRLEFDGISPQRFIRVEGYADTQLKFPADPSASMNRRITLTLLQEEVLIEMRKQQKDLETMTPLVKAEKKKEEELKRSGTKPEDFKKYLEKSGGKSEKPLDLGDLAQKKRRQEYYEKYAVEKSSSSHGGGEAKEAAPAAKPAEGHGGGH